MTVPAVDLVATTPAPASTAETEPACRSYDVPVRVPVPVMEPPVILRAPIVSTNAPSDKVPALTVTAPVSASWLSAA